MTDERRDTVHDESRAAAYAALIDTDGRVRYAIPCRKCGYNLKASAATANCAECGSPIVYTLEADLLVLQLPDWLGRIAGSVRWMLAAYVVLAAWVVVGLVPMISSSLGLPLTLLGGYAYSLTAAIVAPLLLVGFFAFAVWRLTTSPPQGEVALGASESLRRVVWRRMIFCTVFQIIVAAIHVLRQLAFGWPLYYLSLLGELVVTACYFAAIWAVCDYGRLLAGRLAHDRLSRHIVIVKYGLLLSLVLEFAAKLTVIAWVVWDIPVGSLEIWQFAFLPGPVIQLTFGGWGLVLLFAFRRRIVDAAKIAREIRAVG